MFLVKILVRFQDKFLTTNFFIGSLVWKCNETNSKLLLRKIFLKYFLAPSDLMKENCKKWFSPPRKPLTMCGLVIFTPF